MCGPIGVGEGVHPHDYPGSEEDGTRNTDMTSSMPVRHFWPESCSGISTGEVAVVVGELRSALFRSELAAAILRQEGSNKGRRLGGLAVSTLAPPPLRK